MDIEQISGFLRPLIETLAGQNGVVLQVLTLLATAMGTIRLFAKPIITALEQIVLLTPTNKDNALLEEVKKSKVLKWFLFLMDYVLSIKLPKKQLVVKDSQ